MGSRGYGHFERCDEACGEQAGLHPSAVRPLDRRVDLAIARPGVLLGRWPVDGPATMARLARSLDSFDAAGLGVSLFRDGRFYLANRTAVAAARALRRGGDEPPRSSRPGAASTLVAVEVSERAREVRGTLHGPAPGHLLEAEEAARAGSVAADQPELVSASPRYEVAYSLGPRGVPSSGVGARGPAAERDERQRGAAALPGVSVLICDDEQRLATLTAGLLTEHGYEVGVVVTADEALAFLEEPRAGQWVLLLDVHLGGGRSAAELLTRLQQRGLAVPVLLTSGLDPEDVPEELMTNTLVCGYLPKPYSVEELLRLVRRARG